MLNPHIFSMHLKNVPFGFTKASLWGQSLPISPALLETSCDSFTEVVSLGLCGFGLIVLLWVGDFLVSLWISFFT